MSAQNEIETMTDTIANTKGPIDTQNLAMTTNLVAARETDINLRMIATIIPPPTGTLLTMTLMAILISRNGQAGTEGLLPTPMPGQSQTLSTLRHSSNSSNLPKFTDSARLV